MSAPPPPVERLLDLGGLVAIVTGAGGTIGAGIAQRLQEAGAAVVAHRRDLGDVERDAAAICAGAIESFGRLDILVNNAGIQPVAPLESIGNAELAEMFRVNVVGLAAMTREAAALMTGRGGAIVNVASIEGLQPAFDHSHYAASKAAVIMHTRAAALELGPRGIRVNAVSPGVITTPFHDRYSTAEQLKAMQAMVPMNRLGSPDECAGTFLYLASDAASGYVTGQVIEVNGGQYMP